MVVVVLFAAKVWGASRSMCAAAARALCQVNFYRIYFPNFMMLPN